MQLRGLLVAGIAAIGAALDRYTSTATPTGTARCRSSSVAPDTGNAVAESTDSKPDPCLRTSHGAPGEKPAVRGSFDSDPGRIDAKLEATRGESEKSENTALAQQQAAIGREGGASPNRGPPPTNALR